MNAHTKITSHTLWLDRFLLQMGQASGEIGMVVTREVCTSRIEWKDKRRCFDARESGRVSVCGLVGTDEGSERTG